MSASRRPLARAVAHLWEMLLAIVVGLCAFRSAPAQDKAARLPDILLTMRARQLLLEDPTLAPLNLGVRVRNRVAILWGPVPDPDLAHRAVKNLQRLVELTEVRDELFLEDIDPRRAPASPSDSQPLFIPVQPNAPALPPAVSTPLAP